MYLETLVCAYVSVISSRALAKAIRVWQEDR
jgi:hypothetical protein